MNDSYSKYSGRIATNSWENKPVGGNTNSSYMNIHGGGFVNKENSFMNRAPNEPILPSASRPPTQNNPQVFNFGGSSSQFSSTPQNQQISNPFSSSSNNPINQPSPYSNPYQHNPTINPHLSTPYSQPSANIPLGGQVISTPPIPSNFQMNPHQTYVNNYPPPNPIVAPMPNQQFQQPNYYNYHNQMIQPPQPQIMTTYSPHTGYYPNTNNQFFTQPPPQHNPFSSNLQKSVQPGCQFTNPQLLNMLNKIPPNTPNIFANRTPTQVFSACTAAQNSFGHPSAHGFFSASQKSSLGSTFNKPLDKLNNQLRALTPKNKDVENQDNPDYINLPCLILPIPKSLLEEVRKIKPENSSYRTLYNTMEYSDVLIRVKDSDIKAHKAVLYSASPFFRDYLDRLKGIPSSIQTAKIIMPTWFNIDPFKIVLKFMYSCDIEKENINLTIAKDILQIADHLDLIELVRIVVVKFVITQLNKDEVLNFLQSSGSRQRDTKDEAWDYLIDSCAMFAAQNSN